MTRRCRNGTRRNPPKTGVCVTNKTVDDNDKDDHGDDHVKIKTDHDLDEYLNALNEFKTKYHQMGLCIQGIQATIYDLKDLQDLFPNKNITEINLKRLIPTMIGPMSILHAGDLIYAFSDGDHSWYGILPTELPTKKSHFLITKTKVVGPFQSGVQIPFATKYAEEILSSRDISYENILKTMKREFDKKTAKARSFWAYPRSDQKPTKEQVTSLVEEYKEADLI